jgi:chromosome segregation ATPase
MNQVETNQGKEFRDERGYSSLEVMHDRAGETETKVGNYEREGYESAHLIEERRREGGSRKGSQIEECLHDQINELEDEKVGLKNKNIMLNDKISFLNQKLALLETRLEEMEKSYLTTKAEKKEFRGRYETKSKQLKEANQKISELTEEKMKLEEEINRLHSNAEEKSEQVKEMIEKVESLQELNNQLALDNERKSQELMEYSLMRSSINTGNIGFYFNLQDSRTSSGRDQSNKFIYPEKFSNMENKKNSMENFEMGSEGNFNLNAMEQQEVATDRSEYPKGFGMQQVHLEEIIDQKQEIKKLRSEKYELISKMNNIKEDAKLSCFKYEENLRELKSKLKKFKEKEVSDFRGSTWFKKKVSSCKIENELRKKNLKISKLTSQIQKLQGQLKSYPQDSHSIHSKRFSNNQRLSSNTESKNSLYQRE